MRPMWPPGHSLITGASSGIGAAMAIELAGPGAHLTLAGRSHDRLAEVADRCRERGASVSLMVIDVRDREAMARELEAAFASRRVDLLVANAGVSGGTEGDQRAIIDINIGGVLNTVEPVVPLMQTAGGGCIAIMASIVAFKGFPNAMHYCASKAAVRAYGEALAARLRKDRIAVSVLCPGFIRTPLTDTNDFSMPLIMPADDGAKRLLAGIRRGDVIVAFPKRLYAAIRLFDLLPANLASRLSARFAPRSDLKGVPPDGARDETRKDRLK